MAKKYYWLKLKNDFFKRHDIMVIEGMPNGKDYVLFYLKLLVESLSHDGHLRFSDTIPYNEQMLATITNTNVDVVRSAVKVFIELRLMDKLDDGTIYMNEVKNMVGSETEWAKKKREYRLNKEKQGLIEDGSGTIKDNVRQELELELEIEIEKEIYMIFDLWNKNEIGVTHKKLTSDMANTIKTKIKKHGLEKVKTSISRLCKAVHDKNYYYNNRWNLKDFMQQKNGLPKWLDEGQIWNDYCLKNNESKKSQSSSKTSKEARQKTIDYMERNGLEC